MTNKLDRTGNSMEDGIIVVNITVICDNPTSKNYVLIKGEPKNVSLYRFYYVKEDIPGSGAFKKIKTIPLKKIGENKYSGIMILNISNLSKNYTYCVGYPALNYIDDKTCGIIPIKNINNNNIKNKKYYNISVHYWKSLVAVG